VVPLASVQRVLGWWRARSPVDQDVVLAVMVAAGAVTPGMSGTGVLFAQLAARPLDALGVLLVLAQCLPLVVRRRAPRSCLAVVGGAFAAHQLLGYPETFAAVGLFAALYSAGAHLAARRRVTALAASVGYAALALAASRLGSAERLLDYLVFFLLLAACWVVGSVVRARAASEADRQQLVAQAAVAAERARIAAELHDVVTHHVTAMVVQADAAAVLLDTAPDRVVGGLTAISDTGRAALTELRVLLGVLHPTGPDAGRTPAPGSIADLVQRVRAAGQPVELTQTGTPRPVPGAPELTVHRVVQESLTNALKHAPGAPTVVTVHHGTGVIDVAVVTRSPATVPATAPGSGRGLAGLAERVQLTGGQLVAGPGDGGRFEVTARIPVGDRS
jgi:signal transduction histidine kinase